MSGRKGNKFPVDPQTLERPMTRREGLARLVGWTIVGTSVARIDVAGRQNFYGAPELTDELEVDVEPGSVIR